MSSQQHTNGSRKSDIIELASPTKSRPVLSARHRLLKRPSIHNAKLPQVLLGIQANSPAPSGDSGSKHISNGVATQLVDRRPPRKRKQSVDDSYVPRVTRSQAAKVPKEEDSEESSTLGLKVDTSNQPSQLVSSRYNKSKRTVASETRKVIPKKNMPTEATQLVKRRPRKKQKPTVKISPSKKDSVLHVRRDVSVQPIASKQLIVVLPIPRVLPPVAHISDSDLQKAAANPAKNSYEKLQVEAQTMNGDTQLRSSTRPSHKKSFIKPYATNASNGVASRQRNPAQISTPTLSLSSVASVGQSDMLGQPSSDGNASTTHRTPKELGM